MSSGDLRVTVIVLCHNGLAQTRDCLASVRALDRPNTSMLVVDNASSDGTAEAIRADYPEAAILSTGDNLGYAGGNNRGIETALRGGPDALFLINNDTVLNQDCVSALAGALRRQPAAGIVGPLVRSGQPGGVIGSAGGRIDWSRADAVNVGMGQVDEGRYQARPVDFINGCGLMITRTAIERAGLLDERYFMYWEEVEWCQRVWRAGYEVWFDPAAQMRHLAPICWEHLSPCTLYYVTRNRLLFFGECTPLARRPLTVGRALKGALIGIIRHRRSGRPRHARATQLAIAHALLRRWGRVDVPL